VTADQRVTNAREYIGYARHIKVADLPYPALMRLAAELRRQLGQVLDVVTETEADPAEGRLAAIRAVFARFDWEFDDRQYALEEIERIAGGDDQ
jgi:hypothetical protein